MTVSPSTLGYEGGLVTTTIHTRHADGTVPSVDFDVTGPNDFSLSKTESQCGTVNHPEGAPPYVEACWTISFEMFQNESGSPRTYTVTVTSPTIAGTRTGTFTVEVPPP